MLALACAVTLRQRGWDGDGLLADQIEALIGTEDTPMLNPLAVDLEELANILEGDPVHGGGRIDRTERRGMAPTCDRLRRRDW